MPFDIICFHESQTATALSKVAAVADSKYKVSGDDVIVKKKAPWLAGLIHSGVTTPKYAELQQPDLKVPYRFYRATLATTVNQIFGFTDLMACPLPLYPNSKINALVQNATAEASVVTLWLASGLATRAMKEATRPTHAITGYSDTTLTAGSWTDVPITWDQDLPIGRYAVVGMRVGTYHATPQYAGAARLQLLDTDWRVGCQLEACNGDKTIVTHGYSTVWAANRFPLMPEISFEHDQMPDIEIMNSYATTDHVIELLLQKIA